MGNPEQRDLLGKEKFMQGNRQRWCLLFVICSFIVLASTILFAVDPVPFMNFFLALGTTFILGSSASDWAKSQRVGSLRETEVKEETKRLTHVIKDDSKPDTNIIQDFKGRYGNTPDYAPESWVQQQETVEVFR